MLLWLNLFLGNEQKHENMTEQMNSVLSKLDVRNNRKFMSLLNFEPEIKKHKFQNIGSDFRRRKN